MKTTIRRFRSRVHIGNPELEKNPKDSSDLERKHTPLLKDLAPLMFSMKTSWRHKISHVDNKIVWTDTDFSPQVAEEIISATRGFMRLLEKEMPK